MQKAREKLDDGRELIRKMERPYEPHVPDWPDWEPPEYAGVFKRGEIAGYHCRNAEIEAVQKIIDQESAPD